jgi:hypothetical protein
VALGLERCPERDRSYGDIISPPDGRRRERTPRPGPTASATWLTSSVVHPPEHTIAAAFDQAEARDPGHRRTWFVLFDGARHQFDLFHAEADRRRIRVHVLLDIVHSARTCGQRHTPSTHPASPAPKPGSRAT